MKGETFYVAKSEYIHDSYSIEHGLDLSIRSIQQSGGKKVLIPIQDQHD